MKLLQTITVLFLAVNAFGQVDCSDFKTGKFVVPSDEFGDSYIKRTKKYQIETGTDLRTGESFKVKDKIVWLDECTYRLFPISNKGAMLVGDDVLTFKIIETGEDYYLVHITGLENFEMVARVEIAK